MLLALKGHTVTLSVPASLNLLSLTPFPHSPRFPIPYRLLTAGSLDLQDMSRLVDAAASLTSADDAKLQSILEQLDVPDR